VNLEILNASGRRVCSLLQDARSSGEMRVAWDGRDARGRELPSGVYFARLGAGGRTVMEKVILMK
jgi:flagellar hook assembly protein FlgD